MQGFLKEAILAFFMTAALAGAALIAHHADLLMPSR